MFELQKLVLELFGMVATPLQLLGRSLWIWLLTFANF